MSRRVYVWLRWFCVVSGILAILADWIVNPGMFYNPQQFGALMAGYFIAEMVWERECLCHRQT